MTREQELHLTAVKRQFEADVDEKYRKGVEEHGGNVWEMQTISLIEEAMKEAVDQYVYLSTARGKLLRDLAAKSKLNDMGLDARYCTREAAHDGPCNGYPTKSCGGSYALPRL